MLGTAVPVVLSVTADVWNPPSGLSSSKERISPSSPIFGKSAAWSKFCVLAITSTLPQGVKPYTVLISLRSKSS